MDSLSLESEILVIEVDVCEAHVLVSYFVRHMRLWLQNAKAAGF